MTEMMQIIAEVEGVRTPTRKRSKKEVEKAMSEFTEKRAASKKARAAKAATTTKAKADKKTEPKSVKGSVSAIADIKRIAITVNPGNLRSAGYDPKTERLHTEFEKSIREWPNTKVDEWKAFKETFDDKDVDSGSYFRKAFRGRAGSSRRVFDQPATTGASKEAPASKAKAEVKG